MYSTRIQYCAYNCLHGNHECFITRVFCLFILACMNAADSSAMARYRAGYNECANEVSRYLMSLDGLSVQVRTRLLSHLASHCSPTIKPASSSTETPQMNQPQSFTAVPMTSQLELPGLGLQPTFGIAKQLEAGTNLLNSTQFQIVPGQLANGKIAAVLLPSQTAPVAMVSAQQLIPVFNKPGGDLHFQGLHVQSTHALRPDNDPLWRPW